EETSVEVGIFLCVLRRELRQFRCRPQRVSVEAQGAAVWSRRYSIDVRLDHLESVLLELQVFHDFGQKRTCRVQDGRAPESRMYFLSHGQTADNLPSFKYKRRESGLRQIKCCDESVVPAADNDDSSLPLRH